MDHVRADPRTAAACLDAGAARYVTRRSVTEVAACIRSLARPPIDARTGAGDRIDAHLAPLAS
ncbi:MAG: hypothetical protein M3066_02770 [Actinomycetota bacterium]|nr:hypothetical protein [Actinomycetota bacterium]